MGSSLPSSQWSIDPLCPKLVILGQLQGPLVAHTNIAKHHLQQPRCKLEGQGRQKVTDEQQEENEEERVALTNSYSKPRMFHGLPNLEVHLTIGEEGLNSFQ